MSILRHFETNLARSKALIVIGYRFGDERINEYIEKRFLADESKLVFVVGNKEKPVWRHFESKRVHFDDKGVSGITG